MKVLVTGYNGQLGYDVVKRLDIDGITCKGVDTNDFDITDEGAVKSYIMTYKPDVIIHCAAYTAVDLAEENTDICYNVNVLGTKYFAKSANEIGAKLVYISTDYVFEGKGDHYYNVDDPVKPINYYGLSKYQGEEVVRELLSKHFIIRISWVFGENGNNFVRTMLRLAESRDELSVVADQIGSPTYTYDLAKLIGSLIVTDQYGTYHATNTGVCSWYEFAQEIFRVASKEVIVHPIKSEDYPTPATRPSNSRMSKASLTNAGFTQLPSWKDALSRYIAAIEEV